MTTKRKPKKKTVGLGDLEPQVEKQHFHTEDELVAIIRFYTGELREIAYRGNRREIRYDLIRYAIRMVRLAEELP